MKFKTIHSLGSRCQNSDVLKYYNYREFSGFFDFMNTLKVENLIHILNDDFKEILKPDNNISICCEQMTTDPETGEKLETSIRTTNKFYDPDITDVHGAIFPHHDLNTEIDYKHFLKCKERFKKLSNYPTLFNYTFNRWENDITIDDCNEIVRILKEVHGMIEFRICFIGIDYGCRGYGKLMEFENYDIWLLNIDPDSFTGGLFIDEIDNENYISIIKSYDISDDRITLEEINK
jgi:hypothetical protein